MWPFRSDDDGQSPIIIYQYHPTRNEDATAKFFEESEPGTYIIADGYAGYNKLKDFKRCCCYAHIRRYFWEAIPTGKEMDYTDPAVQGFLYCNKLFEYEKSYRKKVSPASRYIIAVSEIRSPSWRLLGRGSISKMHPMAPVWPEL